MGSHIKLHWLKRPTLCSKGGEWWVRDHGVYSPITYPTPPQAAGPTAHGHSLLEVQLRCRLGENTLHMGRYPLRWSRCLKSLHIIWCCVCKMWKVWILEAKGESSSDFANISPSGPFGGFVLPFSATLDSNISLSWFLKG